VERAQARGGVGGRSTPKDHTTTDSNPVGRGRDLRTEFDWLGYGFCRPILKRTEDDCREFAASGSADPVVARGPTTKPASVAYPRPATTLPELLPTLSALC